MGVPFHARRPAPSRRLPPASSSFLVATREVVSEAPAMAWRGAGRRRPRRRRAPPRATDPREGPRGRHPPRRAPRTSCRARQSDDRGRIIHPRSTRVLAPFSSSGGGEGAVSRRGCAYRDRGRHAPEPAANARLEATGAVRAFLPPAPPPALGAGPVTTRPNSLMRSRPKGTFLAKSADDQLLKCYLLSVSVLTEYALIHYPFAVWR